MLEEEKNELAVYNEVKAEVEKYKRLNAELKFDYADSKGEKEARSHIFKLRGVKSKIADVHKSAKAQALDFCRKVDEAKKYLTGEVDTMIDVHMKPIDAIAEHKRQEELAKIEAERLAKEKAEQVRLAEIERQEEDIARKQIELKAQQEAAMRAEKIRLDNIKAEEERIVREREKLEADKKAEADARKREANAKKLAEEKARQDKKNALAKAESDKKAAVEAEKEKARKLEAERQAKIEAEKAEKARLAEIEAKRVADEKHRQKIEKEARYSLRSFIRKDALSDELIKVIVEHIASGNIRHVTILY